MAEGRIRIPWMLRFRRLRDRGLPVAIFAVAAGAAGWLWDRHTGTTLLQGEVEFVRVDLASPAEGVLVSLPGGSPQRFDIVAAGQIIARLDDRPTLAALATLQSLLAQTRSELAAAAATIEQERLDVQRTAAIDHAELILEVQRQRLDIVDRRGVIQADRVELQRLTEEFEYIRRLHEQQAETDFTLRMAELSRDVLARQIAEHEQSLVEAEALLAESLASLETLPPMLDVELDVLLQPLRGAAAVHEAEMRELELQVRALQIRAPFTGEVAAVHAQPGQAVVPGAPVMTLADPLSRSVVVYVRDRSLVWPDQGMRVALFSLRDPSSVYESTIVKVGSQVERLPERHCVDPLVPEWGLPVRIDMPEELKLYPGELVGVMMQP